MGTGNGQNRLCKDWRRLEDWADSHSACCEYECGVETLEGGIPLDRFKHCPDGSEPWRNTLDEDWGYPNLDPEDGVEAFNICQIYEGQVSANKVFLFWSI